MSDDEKYLEYEQERRQEALAQRQKTDWLYVGILVFATVTCVWWITHSPVHADAGQTAPNDPIQTDATDIKPWWNTNFMVVPLSRYDITARVLIHHEYHFDNTVGIRPFDFGLGWGAMSDPANYQKVRFSQDSRWLCWEYDSDLLQKLGSVYIQSHISNNHLIPANAEIRAKLVAVRDNETIRIKGYLVEVRWNDHGELQTMRSGLSNMATGDGACRLIWVEDMQEVF
jgi:hypothetical protein